MEQDKKTGETAWILCPEEKVVNVIAMTSAASIDAPSFHEKKNMTMEMFPAGEGRKVTVAVFHNAIDRCKVIVS